jgi:hypothetical protein
VGAFNLFLQQHGRERTIFSAYLLSALLFPAGSALSLLESGQARGETRTPDLYRVKYANNRLIIGG